MHSIDYKCVSFNLWFQELQCYSIHRPPQFSLVSNLSLQTDPEHSTSSYWPEAVLQLRLRAGTGPFAAIFCPTKQPSREGNQPGLHCRFVPGSGQWLLTEFSLARMEMSVSVWFFICCRSEWGLLIRKYPAGESIITTILHFGLGHGLLCSVWQRKGRRRVCRRGLHWNCNENIFCGLTAPV